MKLKEDDVRDAAYMLREWKHEIKCEGFSSYVETLIKAANQPLQLGVSSEVVESMKEMYQLVEVLDAQLSKITGGNTIYSAILDRAEKALAILEKNRVGG